MRNSVFSKAGVLLVGAMTMIPACANPGTRFVGRHESARMQELIEFSNCFVVAYSEENAGEELLSCGTAVWTGDRFLASYHDFPLEFRHALIDGKRYPVQPVVQGNAHTDSGDWGVFKAIDYDPAPLPQNVEIDFDRNLPDRAQVYLIGYPAGTSLALHREIDMDAICNNRPLTIVKGKVLNRTESAQRDKVMRVVIGQGQLGKGMSGGPVVYRDDEKDKWVIVGLVIAGTGNQFRLWPLHGKFAFRIATAVRPPMSALAQEGLSRHLIREILNKAEYLPSPASLEAEIPEP